MEIYRGYELYSEPARRGRPARRGKFPYGKTFFFDVIEPQLERVNLGGRGVSYTARSVEKVIEAGIAAAAEREPLVPAKNYQRRKAATQRRRAA